LQHEVELDRLEVKDRFRISARRRSEQGSSLAHLQSMAGVVEQTHIGAVQRSAKALIRFSTSRLPRSIPSTTSKPSSRSLAAISAASLLGLRRGGGVLVSGVADDERHALLGRRRRERGEQGRKAEEAKCLSMEASMNSKAWQA